LTLSESLDHLLSASDPFTLFGFEHTFDINTTQLDQRYERLNRQARAIASDDPDKSARLLNELATGHKTLSDPATRGEVLLDALGGRSDPETSDLPPNFLARATERTDTDSYAHEWRHLILTASNLFRQLGSADNGAVQRERRRQIRQALNGLREIQRARERILW
jgi:DnaJ-domain-containing protein 1